MHLSIQASLKGIKNLIIIFSYGIFYPTVIFSNKLIFSLPFNSYFLLQSNFHTFRSCEKKNTFFKSTETTVETVYKDINPFFPQAFGENSCSSGFNALPC